MAGPSFAMLFLLLLILPAIAGLVMIVFSWRRGKGYPACGKCGYDVTGTLGTATARCPECGSDFASVGITPPRARTNLRLMWLGIAMTIMPAVLIVTVLFVARLSYERASRAAQAATVQARGAMQQAQLAVMAPDSALVATYRPKVAGLSVNEASMRLSEITQEIAQRQNDQTLTEENAANLRAEFEALSEHLSGNPPLTPAQP